MKTCSNYFWSFAAAIVLLAAPSVSLNAQEGARGSAPAASVPAPTSPVTGNAVTGKKLYYSYGCYACHGYNGETGARPFVGRWGHLGTEQTFIDFLRGRSNFAPVIPSTQMPNFSQRVLPDKDAKDLYAYIRTFKSS
ncbi:MAG TPA: c-type cytochrome, partial [Bryobacteraceae bacterium]|nr:c-type cytochrome [Bryobacteraceae bacterium]